eukprot:TRINITY_DN7965_c0_g1_i1.p1 TRINITY_DN7965_c0_g1~~TRINITY_DN7965_c0_g1_i1.p1  ORF type:complete len:123 (+),score=16.89 TRINITY_DN7965_c0_g1_i1:54-371(+)
MEEIFYTRDNKFENPLKPLKTKKKPYPPEALGLKECHFFLFNDILVIGIRDEKKPEFLSQYKRVLARDIKEIAPTMHYIIPFYDIPESSRYYGCLLYTSPSPRDS